MRSTGGSPNALAPEALADETTTDGGSDRTVARRKTKGERGGYVYLHSAVDGYSRLAYTEVLTDEKAAALNRVLAEEFLHARPWTSEQERTAALGRSNIHYNYHRPHSTSGGQPPAFRLTAGVTNLMASYN
jgi:transposase InsO family protein